jgi:hypothetical protein
MKAFFALVFIAIVAVGIYYYEHNNNAQNPLTQYQNIIKLPTSQQLAAAAASVKSWVQDPADNTPYPKGWEKVSMTLDGQTFTAISSQTINPPTDYVSLNFPKSQIVNIHLIKCIPTTSSTTEICLIGDNPEVDAYYNIMGWLKNNPVANPSNGTPQ